MSLRISRDLLNTKLAILARKLNKTCGYGVGMWYIDYAKYYGGYIIIEACENGGEHHPLLNQRLRANDMAIALDMAIAVTRLQKGNQ